MAISRKEDGEGPVAQEQDHGARRCTRCAALLLLLLLRGAAARAPRAGARNALALLVGLTLKANRSPVGLCIVMDDGSCLPSWTAGTERRGGKRRGGVSALRCLLLLAGQRGNGCPPLFCSAAGAITLKGPLCARVPARPFHLLTAELELVGADFRHGCWLLL